MKASPPPSAAPGGGRKRRQFWLGIGLGMIPVVVAWIWVGLSNGGASPTTSTVLVYLVALLYLAEIVAAIVLTNQVDRRSIGTGMLTMVVVGPIVWSVGCIVILTHH